MLVLARLLGHGLVVLPHRNYRIEHVADAAETTLRITRGKETDVVDLLVALREKSAFVDVSEGGPPGAWRIQTKEFTCGWPRGFALSADDAGSPFLLTGPSGSLVWVDGPLPKKKATPIENLVADEQRVRAVAQEGENARIDLDYEEEGEHWWQRRYALVWGNEQVLVVSGQALLSDEEAARAAVDEVARTIEPYRPS